MPVPRSLSASSLAKYELCPARWKAETFNYSPGIENDAALCGTVCHAVLERWVKEGHYRRRVDIDVATQLFDAEYRARFSDDRKYADGLQMVVDWVERQDWSDREVLTTEVKQHFDIKTSAGTIKVNYIFDRCDKLDDGEIEVVDYKTFAMPMQPSDMRGKIQPRMYALAAQMMYPHVERVWVTYDLLRFGPVGIAFTKAENRATWTYLKDAAERIIADDCKTERLNTECRWCLRRHQCSALNAHIRAGGPLSINDPGDAARQRKELAHAIDASKTMLDDLDKFLLAAMEEQDVQEIEGVQVSVRKTREIDPLIAKRILGPELVADTAGKVSITAIDKLMKSDQITQEQKAALKKNIRQVPGRPFIKSS